MAVEGLRALEAAATRLGIWDDAARWATHRAAILHGIDTSLTYAHAVLPLVQLGFLVPSRVRDSLCF
eukprot:m.114491 g.114491  ORF g.114491 m.114491 type:complete len:67 (+) comp13054_c0_seq1:374-574(+)